MQRLKILHDEMLTGGISFCFTGYMSEEVVLGIGKALRKKFAIDELDKRTSMGMFSIFVEMVQNVVRYSAENRTDDLDPVIIDLRYGVLSIGQQDGRYFVACGNLIEEAHVPRLRDSLTHIKSLDKDGLKKLFRKSLQGEVPEGSKGAGVGFIEIARRAGNGFDYDFRRIDDEHSFFALKAFI